MARDTRRQSNAHAKHSGVRMTRILMHEGKIRLGAHRLPFWQDGG
jgi:hypothetical protein